MQTLHQDEKSTDASLLEKISLEENVVPDDIKQQVGELVAAYEIAMDRIAQKEKAMENQFQTVDKFLNNQIEKIHLLMDELRETITEAGAARWRLSAQDLLRIGDLQVNTVKKLSEETKRAMDDSCSRFEKTSQFTVKNIQDAITSFKPDEFKQFAEQSCEEVKTKSVTAIEKIHEILTWFQWKNMAMALGLSIVAAVVIGLYIDDEWPWELHDTVVKERAAGQALMNAWPHLDEADHRYLENKLLEAAKKNQRNI